jgi:hypothetical protein
MPTIQYCKSGVISWPEPSAVVSNRCWPLAGRSWRVPGCYITVLLVEQNANKALHIAHYGYVLETGRVTLMDEAKKLLQNDHVRRSYLGE